MTPFEERGYTPGDRFRVKEDGVDNSAFLVEDIIILHVDDGSNIPSFCKEYEDDYYYVQLCNIERVYG